MRNIINSINLMICLAFLFQACKSGSTKESQKNNLQFEESLIPKIQDDTNPQYFNLEERMKYYKIPGFSITTIKNGKIDIAKGYGYARKQDSVLVDTNTVFHAGSISKSITALIILKLRDEKIVDLDTDINKYLKSWKLPENKFTRQKAVTLRTLLNHTSGIKTYNSKGYSVDESLPSLIDILDGKSKEPAVTIDTIPGTIYKYSSRGYSIIQLLIEDVTKKRFEDVAKSMIFEPLKMTKSTFKTIYPTSKNTDYSYSYNKEGVPNNGYWNYKVQKSAGGLKTTPTDLAKLCIAVSNSLNSDIEFLKMTSAKEMMTGENYGLGFDVKGENVLFRFSHSGRVPGFFAYMVLYPETGDGLVMLTNSDNGGKLFIELLRGFTEINNWDLANPKRIKSIEISQKIMDQYLGSYVLNLESEKYEIQISQKDKNLYYQLIGDNAKYLLKATSNTEFIDMIDGEKFEFTDIKEKALKVITNSEYEYKRREE